MLQPQDQGAKWSQLLSCPPLVYKYLPTYSGFHLESGWKKSSSTVSITIAEYIVHTTIRHLTYTSTQLIWILIVTDLRFQNKYIRYLFFQIRIYLVDTFISHILFPLILWLNSHAIVVCRCIDIRQKCDGIQDFTDEVSFVL